MSFRIIPSVFDKSEPETLPPRWTATHRRGYMGSGPIDGWVSELHTAQLFAWPAYNWLSALSACGPDKRQCSLFGLRSTPICIEPCRPVCMQRMNAYIYCLEVNNLHCVLCQCLGWAHLCNMLHTGTTSMTALLRQHKARVLSRQQVHVNDRCAGRHPGTARCSPPCSAQPCCGCRPPLASRTGP